MACPALRPGFLLRPKAHPQAWLQYAARSVVHLLRQTQLAHLPTRRRYLDLLVARFCALNQRTIAGYRPRTDPPADLSSI